MVTRTIKNLIHQKQNKHSFKPNNPMKKIESYIDVARNFNSSLSNNSNLQVVNKPNNNNSDRGSNEYIFSDGVMVRHTWKGNLYFGHRDYDHNIEVINDAGYQFEKKSLSYNMQNSKHL